VLASYGLNLIGNHTECKSFNPSFGLFPSRTLGKYSWKAGNLGDVTVIFFSVEFNLQEHMNFHCTFVHETALRQSLALRASQEGGKLC